MGKEGVVVHEGIASGIWSCQPDGSDARWHSLGCGDNPVEVDFTPEGEILGVQNIFHTNPRGDTIVHWLRGGVYPRPDMLKAIEGLPRTLDTMPDGQSFLGVIRASLPDVLVFADAGAQEHRIPHAQINTNTTLTTSLMPQGLDKALTEQQLMDLVAFLRSRK